jgi:protocatechuate 3,4-dioxygenase alpha subunit
MDLVPSPSQTIGPFFQSLLDAFGTSATLVKPEVPGERLRLAVRVLDGDGAPVNDAMIELWQAGIGGFGRLPTGEDGACVFETVKTPHVNVSVFARGLLNRVVTRIYFAGEPANERDFVLTLVPEDRRATLMAHPDPEHSGVWKFDIHLCGEFETVFFDV